MAAIQGILSPLKAQPVLHSAQNPSFRKASSLGDETFLRGNKSWARRARRVANRKSCNRRFTSSVQVSQGGTSGAEGSQSQSAPSSPPLLKRKESLSDRITAYLVNGGGSSAIGSFMAEPTTWLHRMDPRVKQLWLIALVALPARSGLALRGILCLFLVLVTVLSLPKETSVRQLVQAAALSLLLFFGLCFGSEGIKTVVQARDMPQSVEPLPPLNLGAPPPGGGGAGGFLSSLFGGGYRYVLLSWGPFQITRRGVKLGAMAASLSFIILQSASLSLTTTTPEATTRALRWLLTPLRKMGAPVDAVVMTLLLSLRFMGLVFEEVRSLALGVVARGIDWKRLQWLGTIDLLVSLAGRLFQNLFSHADQIAQAMVARGFEGDPTRHQLFLFAPERGPLVGDWVASALLVIVCVGAWSSGLLLAA